MLATIKMTEETINLIETWIEFQRSDNPELQWTVMAFDDLTNNNPEIAWDALRTTYEKIKNEPDIVGMLAAGPLEDLLSKNGEKVLENLRSYIESNPEFKECLNGVWQNLMSDDFYIKVKSITE